MIAQRSLKYKINIILMKFSVGYRNLWSFAIVVLSCRYHQTLSVAMKIQLKCSKLKLINGGLGKTLNRAISRLTLIQIHNDSYPPSPIRSTLYLKCSLRLVFLFILSMPYQLVNCMLYLIYSLIWCVTTDISIHCQYSFTFSAPFSLQSPFAHWRTCKYNLKQILLVETVYSHTTGLIKSTNIL